jgi:hypothetical protein
VIAVYRHRGDGVVVSHLFLAADIGMTVSSVAGAETTKKTPTPTTNATMNGMRRSGPFTPRFHPPLREGNG